MRALPSKVMIGEAMRLSVIEKVIRSGWEWELPRQPEDFRTNSIFENLAGALNWLAEGRVNVDGIYTKYDPEKCQQAYRDLLHKKTPRLAVVFDWAT